MPVTSSRIAITDHAASNFAWEVVVLAAPNGSGTPDDAGNLCDNPELAVNSSGWGAEGGSPNRTGVSDHIAATFGWEVVVQADAPPPPPPPPGGGGGGGGGTPGSDGAPLPPSNPTGPNRGALYRSQDFDGNSLDTGFWGVYEGVQSQTGEDWRASNIVVANGMVSLYGQTDGTQAGMAANGAHGQVDGVWEFCARFQGWDDAGHDPVALLWPDSEVWPCDGEIDWPEIYSHNDFCEGWTHYNCSNAQDYVGRHNVDLTQWNIFAVERRPGLVGNWLNNVRVFSTGNDARKPMHQTFQINNLGSGRRNGASQVVFQVAWWRQYL